MNESNVHLRPESTVGIMPRNINWSAIVMGTITFFAVQFLFTLLGTAIGLASLDVGGEGPGTGSAIAGGLFAIVSILVSFFVAGYVASRFAESRLGRHSFLQGFATWALITGVAAYLLSSGVGSLAGGLGSMANSLVQGGASNVRGIEQTVRRNDQRVSTGERARAEATATRVADDARKGVAGASALTFLALSLGLASCLFGAVLNHRKHYLVETRLTRTIDTEDAVSRPRRIA